MSEEAPATTAKPSRVRGALGAALILVAALLAPFAIVGGWSQTLLRDSDAFAATYGPLIRDEGVQTFLTDRVVDAIDQQIDVDAMVGEVIDALTGVVVRPRPQAALELLRQPAIEGIRSSIHSATATVVTSDAFAVAWEESLLLSHSQAVAVLGGDPDVVLTGTEDGLGIRLAPIIERVKARLIDQGFALAEQIPVIDRTVVIVPVEWLPQAQFGYRAALAGGYWLPVLVLVLLIGGVLVSVRRRLATVWAAVGLGLGALLLLGSIAVGGWILGTAIPAALMPPDVTELFYRTASGALVDLAWAVLLLAAVVGVGAWLTGRSRPAVGLRRGYDGARGGLRVAAEKQGVSTGRVGEWLFAQRLLTRVLVGLAAIGFLLANRPLSVGLVLGTAAVSLLALLVLSLAERPEPAGSEEP